MHGVERALPPKVKTRNTYDDIHLEHLALEALGGFVLGSSALRLCALIQIWTWTFILSLETHLIQFVLVLSPLWIRLEKVGGTNWNIQDQTVSFQKLGACMGWSAQSPLK